ncbi:hypothetical protein [Streptomyces sp. XY431]|uniref:hypothetical protein n=1 Tax=Streptomyces sp. XY431 TaxID=1415562 RepID=UPI001331ABA0|nr:hypothetical protein [Streptomyces sp. XY431]
MQVGDAAEGPAADLGAYRFLTGIGGHQERPVGCGGIAAECLVEHPHDAGVNGGCVFDFEGRRDLPGRLQPQAVDQADRLGRRARGQRGRQLLRAAVRRPAALVVAAAARGRLAPCRGGPVASRAGHGRIGDADGIATAPKPEASTPSPSAPPHGSPGHHH